MTVSPQVMFSDSPVHTDEYYERIVRDMAGWDGLDTIILGDEAGVLSSERARRGSRACGTPPAASRSRCTSTTRPGWAR